MFVGRVGLILVRGSGGSERVGHGCDGLIFSCVRRTSKKVTYGRVPTSRYL